jgi:CheY-like chemotaxis protein
MSLILVVEDERLVRTTIAKMLNLAGHEVVQTESGKGALQLCQKRTFDLIITDLAMPDMDGLELIRSLRRAHVDFPVLAISGAFGGQFLKAAELLGAVGILDKPFGQDEFLAMVNKSFGKHPKTNC